MTPLPTASSTCAGATQVHAPSSICIQRVGKATAWVTRRRSTRRLSAFRRSHRSLLSAPPNWAATSSSMQRGRVPLSTRLRTPSSTGGGTPRNRTTFFQQGWFTRGSVEPPYVSDNRLSALTAKTKLCSANITLNYIVATCVPAVSRTPLWVNPRSSTVTATSRQVSVVRRRCSVNTRSGTATSTSPLIPKTQLRPTRAANTRYLRAFGTCYRLLSSAQHTVDRGCRSLRARSM